MGAKFSAFWSRGDSSISGWFLRLFGITATNTKNRTSNEVKSALIVVDMQNDFLTGSLSLSACPSKHNGEEIIPVINEMVKLPVFDAVVYTMDWHPADHISFVSNVKLYDLHEDNKIDPNNPGVFQEAIFHVDHRRTDQVLWPVHCIQDSEGSKLHKDLLIADESIIIKKGNNRKVDSYSAFFDNKRLSETSLRSELHKRNIKRVIICGVASDVCVNYTAFDACDLGFETYVVEDACRGVDCESIQMIFEKMKKVGISLITSSEVEAVAQQGMKGIPAASVD